MQILSPIKFYLVPFIAFLSIAELPAQILYTNVIPNQIFFNNGVYHLDINNDGINDFSIKYTVAFAGVCSDIAQLNYSVRVTPTLCGSVANDGINPVKLDSGIFIDKSYSWSKDSNQLLFSMNWACSSEYWNSTANGNWINATHNFLPLKLRLGGHTYFGWLGIDVVGYPTSFGSFIIKDYAFNTVPSQPILAGEQACTIPVVTVTACGPLSFCAGDSVVLTANSNAYKYQWKKDGVNILGATSQSYTAKTAGTYKVKVTNSCGNKTSKNRIVSTPCKINQVIPLADELEHLSVYPNPAVSTVNIHLPTDDESTLQVINLFGETVFTAKTTSEELVIDANNFAAGIYTARWMSGENSESKTFSVVR